MMMPDVNVLIGAFRIDSPHHADGRAWLNRVVLADAAFGISCLVLSSVIRITTHRSFAPHASSLDEAFGFCADITGQPHCCFIEPGDRHWAIFGRLCRETGTTGARVTDAWLAALAIEHGCEWITFDRDFARFPGLKWSVPG